MAAPELVAPAFLSIPDEYDERRTLGPEVGAVATLAGFPPDPEQQLLLDVSFALDKRGDPLIFDSTVIAPRQNLKTGFLKQRALGKLYVTDRRLVVWSAHEFTTVQEAARDLEELISGSDTLRRRVKLTNRGEIAKHGALPEIELTSTARLIFKTRTGGGGVGLSGDDTFVDEGWAAQPAQMGALLPIMLARPGSQVDFASSACRPESAYLWSRVQRGRKGAGPRSLYAEWCAPEPGDLLPDGTSVCDRGEACTHGREAAGCGCDKPEVIRIAHPAVTRGRITVQKVLDLRGNLPPEQHAREIMGWHDEPVLLDAPPITVERWTELGTEATAPARCGFALDVSPDRLHASIGAAGAVDGRHLLFLVGADVGTSWVLPKLVELKADKGLRRIAVDAASPAASLIPQITEAGIEVDEISLKDMGRACGDLADAVRDGTVAHLGDPLLTDALHAATVRSVGDGGWAWRRKGSGNITPIVSLTLALDQARNAPAPEPFVMVG